MIDKEKKNKIADILLDFYDEYYSNEINRPMIPSIYAGKILDSLQEEPIALKVLEDMLNAKTAAESLGISQEEHDKIVDKLIYGKEPELVDIDDLPKEEPVSEELEEAMQHNAQNNIGIDDLLYWRNGFIAGANWQKTKDESTTEDLGEYINKLSKQFPEVSFAKLSRIAVRVAKWQKEKDQSTIELAEDHAMLAGMEKMKDEMMVKAIDAHCFGFQGDALFSFKLPADKYLVGSKVKVIVIKEE